MSDGCGHRSGWDLYDGTCKGCGTAASTLYEEMRDEAEGYKAQVADLEGREITEEMIDRAAAELERDKFECGLYTSDRELAAGILRVALREGE